MVLTVDRIQSQTDLFLIYPLPGPSLSSILRTMTEIQSSRLSSAKKSKSAAKEKKKEKPSARSQSVISLGEISRNSDQTSQKRTSKLYEMKHGQFYTLLRKDRSILVLLISNMAKFLTNMSKIGRIHGDLRPENILCKYDSENTVI